MIKGNILSLGSAKNRELQVRPCRSVDCTLTVTEEQSVETGNNCEAEGVGPPARGPQRAGQCTEAAGHRTEGSMECTEAAGECTEGPEECTKLVTVGLQIERDLAAKGINVKIRTIKVQDSAGRKIIEYNVR